MGGDEVKGDVGVMKIRRVKSLDCSSFGWAVGQLGARELM